MSIPSSDVSYNHAHVVTSSRNTVATTREDPKDGKKDDAGLYLGGIVNLEPIGSIIDQAEEWNKRAGYDEAERLCRTALEALPSEESVSADEYVTIRVLRARALRVLANSYWSRGQGREALSFAQEAYRHAVETTNTLLIASTLHSLGNVYGLLSEPQTAREQYLRALALYEELAKKDGIAGVLTNLGLCCFYLGTHADALVYFQRSIEIYEELEDRGGVAINYGNIGMVYSELSDYPRAIENYRRNIEISREIGDVRSLAGNLHNLASIHLFLSDYALSLEYFEQALAVNQKVGNKGWAANNLSTIGEVYRNLGDYNSALEYYQQARIIYEEIHDTFGLATVITYVGIIYQELSDSDRALEYYGVARQLYESIDSKRGLAYNYANLGTVYSDRKEYAAALENLTHAINMHDELGNRTEAARLLGNIGNIYAELSEYEKALKYLDDALAKQTELGVRADIANTTGNIGSVYAQRSFRGYNPVKAEQYLLGAIATSEELGVKGQLCSLTKSLSELYEREQRWEDFALRFKTYHELEKEVQSEAAKKTSHQIEQRRKTEERENLIAISKAKHEATEQLLHNVLPPSIAQKMLNGSRIIADKFQSVTVLFADIVDFTKLSQRISPEELVAGLDGIFSAFDALVENYGVEKIKTIGDAYMVVAGAPESRQDHAFVVAQLALDMLQAMKQFQSIATGEDIQIRIGIHSGEAVAGVIGKKKFAYDLWGDAVNIASRMESHGEADHIHCSSEFVEELSRWRSPVSAGFRFRERGNIDVKGKGSMRTYFLEKA